MDKCHLYLLLMRMQISLTTFLQKMPFFHASEYANSCHIFAFCPHFLFNQLAPRHGSNAKYAYHLSKNYPFQPSERHSMIKLKIVRPRICLPRKESSSKSSSLLQYFIVYDTNLFVHFRIKYKIWI